MGKVNSKTIREKLIQACGNVPSTVSRRAHRGLVQRLTTLFQATAQQHLVSSLRDGKKNTRTRSAAEWSNVTANKKAYEVVEKAYLDFLEQHEMSRSKNSTNVLWKPGSPDRYPSMRAAAAAVAKRRQKALLHKRFLAMRQKCLDVTFASASLLCSEKSAAMLRRLDMQRRTRHSPRRKTKTRPFKLSMRKKTKSQRQKKKELCSGTMSNFTLYSSYVGEPPSLASASKQKQMPNNMFPKWQKPFALPASARSDPLPVSARSNPLPASTSKDPLPKWQTNETKLPASKSRDALPQRAEPRKAPSQPTSEKFVEKAQVAIDSNWHDAVTRPRSAANKPGLQQLPDTFARRERPSHRVLFGSSPHTTPREPSLRTAWNGRRHESSS